MKYHRGGNVRFEGHSIVGERAGESVMPKDQYEKLMTTAYPRNIRRVPPPPEDRDFPRGAGITPAFVFWHVVVGIALIVLVAVYVR